MQFESAIGICNFISIECMIAYYDDPNCTAITIAPRSSILENDAKTARRTELDDIRAGMSSEP